jgi:hypothetical protein
VGWERAGEKGNADSGVGKYSWLERRLVNLSRKQAMYRKLGSRKHSWLGNTIA